VNIFGNEKILTNINLYRGLISMGEYRKYYYARVSSKEQNLDRQLLLFKQMGATDREIITDKVSGKDLDRPGYQALKTTLLRSGDTLVVKSLDRLSRKKIDIKCELEWYKENGIRIMVLDLPTTMIEIPEGQEWIIEMVNNILIEVLSSIAEQERVTIHQRQAEGIAAAKAKGKFIGRPIISYPEGWDELYTKWKSGTITAKKMMEELRLKRTTFYKLVKRWEVQTKSDE
jgi:DNA invertase Pin-like site-specific DNA recombinase